MLFNRLAFLPGLAFFKRGLAFFSNGVWQPCSCQHYSGNRLIHPRLMQPTAYYIQIAWHGIFLILSHYKNPG